MRAPRRAAVAPSVRCVTRLKVTSTSRLCHVPAAREWGLELFPWSAISPAMSTPVMLRQRALSSKPVNFGNAALRSCLALVLFWIGGMKFTAYEAAAIQPLIATSPLMSWLYRIFSVRGASDLIGIAELTIAVLILLRPISPRATLAGGLGAIAMFLTTLSFILSLPGGVWAAGLGFPLLGEAGGFLIKDVVLLGASVAIATEAYSAIAS